MRIGYPVVNLSLPATEPAFDVVSPRPDQVARCVAARLDRLRRVLDFNADHGLLLYRMRHDLVPITADARGGSDPLVGFEQELSLVGRHVRTWGMRLSFHADLATLLHVTVPRVLEAALAPLRMQARILDAMGLDSAHRIQFHAGVPREGGKKALDLFLERFADLDPAVRSRLALENDNVGWDLADCFDLHERIGVPIVFDYLHFRNRPRDLGLRGAMTKVAATWAPGDGPMVVDYSSQRPRKLPGWHALTLDEADFLEFLNATAGLDFDVMCELKDREKSAIRALALLEGDPRLQRGIRYRA